MPNGKQGNTGSIKNAQERNLSTKKKKKKRVEIIELAMSKEGSKGR